jgi:phage-related minor tail protein
MQGGNMERFIPYNKLSKKEKRKHDQAKRQTWGAINPVTRKSENSNAYNRKKNQYWKNELPLY